MIGLRSVVLSWRAVVVPPPLGWQHTAIRRLVRRWDPPRHDDTGPPSSHSLWLLNMHAQGTGRAPIRREADGPPGGRLYFGADGTPSGRSRRWRLWRGDR